MSASEIFSPDMSITVHTQFLEHESSAEKKRFVFAYTISIQNHSSKAVKLLTRYWKITDINNKVQEVEGEGVIGQKPRLEPGQEFEYTSGAVLETNAGTMEGHYQFISDDNDIFDAPIPIFSLIDPSQLH
ncbi:MAG: Co2+/Mg2+ efflux protein ApaG [Sinobacterium sp.]|nr:Co2+/Mg2+ efflux protein ApaG [Sinobacterium sp.]